MLRDFASYFAIVLVGYGVDVAAYIILMSGNCGAYVSYVLAMAIGMCANVVLLRRFFKKGRFTLIKDIWLTLVANATVLSLGFVLYGILMVLLGAGPLTSKLISSAVTFGINFSIRKRHF